jgi:hypothetical protein
MSENTATVTNGDDELQRPGFKGCVFCYSAEIAAYAVKKAIR